MDESLEWITIFRMDENDGWLYNEIKEGRLRQGWGPPGCNLLLSNGNRVDKYDWEENYRSIWNENPTQKRFAILSYMLDIGEGDVVVVPKMPQSDQFTIARVSGGYEFDAIDDTDVYGHIIPVEIGSVRTFSYKANSESFLVSCLFARANHRSAISFSYDSQQIRACLKLLNWPDQLDEQSDERLFELAYDAVFKEAAKRLLDEIQGWNADKFEKAIRRTFEEQGYRILLHRRYDSEGGDADILMSMPPNPYEAFLPEQKEIAVQVKWKKGVDEDDLQAVDQIVKWSNSFDSQVTKCVISSAKDFTKKAKKEAKNEDVILINGLQTMCFLLGIPDRYRDDWEETEGAQ